MFKLLRLWGDYKALQRGPGAFLRRAAVRQVLRPQKLRIRRNGVSRALSQDVKIAVAERDNGQCVKCGSREDLQFDHKVPFSWGGEGTIENIQLLCGRCNRRKSNHYADH